MRRKIPVKAVQRVGLVTTIIAGFAASCLPSRAATQDEFQKAFAAAESADKEAASHKNQWTTTEKALADAKKAANAGKFDEAVNLAKEAEALAKASVEQSRREDTDWRNAVIK